MYLRNKINTWRKETFINNNTFSSYLHSKDEVLHTHLNLLENMLLCQPPRWYDKVPPNWALISPTLDFLPPPKPFLAPNPQALVVLVLPWQRSPVWVYADNKPIRPLHFPFFFSMTSKLLSNNSSLLLGLNDWVLNVGKPVSIGMTASAP